MLWNRQGQISEKGSGLKKWIRDGKPTKSSPLDNSPERVGDNNTNIKMKYS